MQLYREPVRYLLDTWTLSVLPDFSLVPHLFTVHPHLSQVLWVATDEVAFDYMDVVVPGCTAMFPWPNSVRIQQNSRVQHEFSRLGAAMKCTMQCYHSAAALKTLLQSGSPHVSECSVADVSCVVGQDTLRVGRRTDEEAHAAVPLPPNGTQVLSRLSHACA